MNDPTSVTATAVEAIADLARRGAEPRTTKVGDYTFSKGALERVDTDPTDPVPLEFFTLGGFADYLKAEGEAEKPLVHVVSPTQVDAVSRLIGQDKNRRRVPARAICRTAKLAGFQFNAFLPLEALHIALQTCFAPSKGQVDELRRFCAAVRSTQETGVDDDGVSQTVAAKSGIAAVLTTKVNNPWPLAPWRTFAELDQPISPFVLRFKEAGDPQVGLFETGDAIWQVIAVKAIAGYLREALGTDWTVLG